MPVGLPGYSYRTFEPIDARDFSYAVLDPSFKEGKYEEEGRKGRVELKNGVIALCTPETLAEDTANRTPSFYMFWRK